MTLPLLSRLRSHEYIALLLALSSSFLKAPPKVVINWFYHKSRFLFPYFVGASSATSGARRLADRIRKASDFEDLGVIFGYHNVEEHVVLTKDGYLLGIHRIPGPKWEPRPIPGTSTGKPVVYLHHGLLMNSEVWVCLTNPERSVPFVLAELGYERVAWQ